MEKSFTAIKLSPYLLYTIIALVVALVSTSVGFQLWMSSDTIPTAYEGFAAAPHIGPLPNCINASEDSAEIYSTFLSKTSITEEGVDDLKELSILLGKIACLKRDLMSPGRIVNATKSSPFSTMHDIEPVAETAARCFTKTIPVRDIDIILDKWITRGKMLLERLCTSYSLTTSVQEKTLKLFKSVIEDIKNLMKTTCSNGDATIAGMPTPRMINGKEPDTNTFFGEYKGYY